MQGIANGSLPEARFKHYLVQDYLYLVWLFTALSTGALIKFPMNSQVHFARSNALASYKGKSMESIAAVSTLPVNGSLDSETQYGIVCPDCIAH